MNRREALRRVAILTGAAISMPLAGAILQGCESGANTGVAEGLKYMTQVQYDVFNELAGRIIPKTETPGAKEAGVTDFVDTMLAEFYSEKESKEYVGMIDEFEKTCKAENGQSFTKMTDEERDIYLEKVEAAAHQERDLRFEKQQTQGSKTLVTEAEEQPKPIFWFTAKQAILSAFFISEVGKTQVQQHITNPGPFQGCVPLADAGEGRAWASDW